MSRFFARSRELCPCREFSELSLGQAGTQPPGPLGGSANGDGTCVSGAIFFFLLSFLRFPSLRGLQASGPLQPIPEDHSPPPPRARPDTAALP